MRHITIKKYRAIQSRFKILYEGERRRYDDVITMLKDEFFIDHENTVMRILRTDLPAENEKASADAEAQSN